MADDKEKMKVVFAPEFFEDFEGTQEELDELVKEIMELHEGRVEMSSELGVGTTVVLWLPAALRPKDEENVVPEASA